MSQFEIRNFSFSYPQGNEVLSRIDVTIDRGQYVTVCGKSGSGKTTLLRQLKSVLAPHGKAQGEIRFEGKPLGEVSLRDQAARIGYVMQNPDSQIVTDKVWHELAFGLESLGLDQKTIRLRVAEMASYFGIQGWFHKNVSELSGGQKQLLNMASIMAMQPKVLILDEPTSQLDPIAASDFLNTVRKINRELRTTIIITEHRLEDILYASDKVVVLDGGRKIADDVPERIGHILKASDHEMFEAMPTPVQIYFGVPNDLPCPLTVREGGEWLDTLLEGRKIRVRCVEEDARLPHTAKGAQGTDAAWKPTDELEELLDPRDPAVELKELWFRYEKDAPDVLKGVSMKVPRGRLFAVVGGNGTGKSTMLRNVCGVLRPYSGKVFIDGKRLDKYPGDSLFKGVLAMLPQDPQSLFAKKTVREELEEMLPRGGYGEQAGNAGDELTRIAQICEVTHLLEQHPYDLSGGEQQRAALAKVLLTHPKILLLDEPTKGIDSFFKKKLAGILGKLKEQGVTIIMVSHDVEFCARYADSVSMFFDGSIITTNTPNRFFAQNSFYTTAANRMSRHVFENAVVGEDVVRLCKENLRKTD